MTHHRECIGVAVVDDNNRIGESVERWLSGLPGYQFLGAYGSAEAALVGITAAAPRVLLLDVDMPGSDAFALLARVTAEFPQTRVVMLSGHVKSSYITRALDGGAAGYIVKDEGMSVIMELMLRAADGEVVLSPTAKKSLVARTK